jgi:hypothetical protein
MSALTDHSIPLVSFISDTPTASKIGNVVSDFKLKEKSGLLLPEPLLMEDKSRFVLFPIKHTDVSVYDVLLRGVVFGVLIISFVFFFSAGVGHV